ncbi:VRR-NUC domain-containing protein, partial [Lentinula edodes]
DPSRYILIRLGCRKPGWHTRRSLSKYVSEVGECGINIAVKELCMPVSEIIKHSDGVSAEMKTEVDIQGVKVEREVIDLTEDLDDEPKTCPSLHIPSSSPSELRSLSYLCEDEAHMTLDEALARLSVDEVKSLVKDCKVKARLSTKDGLIQALKRHAHSQGNLSTMMRPHAKQRSPRQTQLSFCPGASSSITQEARLQHMAVQKLGSCLRVNPEFHNLLQRLDIIFYRSTSIPETVFLNSFLTVFKKRVYPAVTSARSTIWPTRDAYLDYEEGLKLQAIFDSILEDTIVKPKGSVIPVGSNTQFRMPTSSQTKLVKESINGAVKMEQDRQGQEVTVKPEYDFEMVDLSTILGPEFRFEFDEDDQDSQPKASLEKCTAAARVVAIYDAVLKSKWDFCVSVTNDKLEESREPSLQRFEQGYVLARLIWKVTEAYALLHKYEKELEVLQSLLAQKFWRQAKRGKWYERRALVQDHHLPKLYRSRAERNGWSKQHLLDKTYNLSIELREGLYEAMEDTDTHRVYHKSLVKRLTKVESRMKVSVDDRHTYDVQLQDANDICVFAHRAQNATWTGERSAPRWKTRAKEGIITNWLIRDGFAYASDESEEPSGKSIWKTLDGSSTCNVETRVLQHYAQEQYGGFQGFHSETCILTTIFGLLFWDIIFADIPGAFETPYQIAPLDLVEDSFYYARKELIKSRLKELKDGDALKILDRHDKLYRESKTWCVGVRWDVCGKDELAEIVECIGGEALEVICELFCHDYPARASGVPDLILWKHEERKCKFVEVKGPGDRARDNQTLWFDTLLGAGLDVDLCRVLEENTKNVNAEKEKQKTAKGTKLEQRKRRKAKREESDSDNADELDMDMDVNADDEADFRGPENVDELDPSPPVTRMKRRRSLEDGEGERDSESRPSVLATLQDKIAFPEWFSVPIVDIPHAKRLKTCEGD